MKQFIKYIIPFCLGVILSACSESGSGNREPAVQPELKPIILSSEAEGAVYGNVFGTRAEADGVFPNGGSIGIIAARYPADTPDEEWTPDWKNSYPDIVNATATASGYDQDTQYYSFQWDRQRYWPFDGGNLIFMAYSPHADNVSSLFLSDTEETLLITLTDPMADILYASNNDATPYKVYNKLTPTVDLGTFKHVMSQLTVVVEALQGMAPTIELTNLRVSTTNTEASFFLESGDEGLIVAEDPSLGDFTYTLVSQNTPFNTTPFSDTVMLFPGTEENTLIHFELVDTAATGSSISKTVSATFFAPNDVGADPVTLQRGKNTVLTIKVSSISATQQDFSLQGQITDWIPGGGFHIDIK